MHQDCEAERDKLISLGAEKERPESVLDVTGLGTERTHHCAQKKNERIIAHRRRMNASKSKTFNLKLGRQ